MRGPRAGIVLSLIALMALGSDAIGQSRGDSRGGSRHHQGTNTTISPVTINPSPGSNGSNPSCPPNPGPIPVPIVFGWGPWLPIYSPFPPPIGLTAPMAPPLFFTFPDVVVEPQPTFLFPRAVAPPLLPPRPRARDANRAKELIGLGDRLFRAGNLIRACERYEQAIRADGDLAAPRARLAQVALVRGKYQDAANRLREAQAAEPGWLATARDVQDLYPEPAVYARHVAALEAHLQARPEDRDGWLVLGALWYLSGKTQKAADVFLRLSDRREDPTLRAFLDATKAEPAAGR